MLRVDISGNWTYTVAVTTVAETNDGVRVTYTDGSTVTVAGVRSPADLEADALDGASTVDPVVDGPGVSVTTSGGTGSVIAWPADASTVLYSVADGEDRLLAWDYVDCGDDSLRELILPAVTISNVDASSRRQRTAAVEYLERIFA